MIKKLQEILNEDARLTLARFEGVIQVLMKVNINGKDYMFRVDVKKIEDFLNEKTLDSMLVKIKAKKVEMVGV